MGRDKIDLVADILIAVDAPDVRNAVTTNVSDSSGVRSISALNAEQLINRLTRERYDALVISESFFGLGYQGLVSLIRSGDLCAPNLPVVLVTNSRNAGIDDVAKRYFVRTISTSGLGGLCANIGAAIIDRPRPRLLAIDDNDHFLSLLAEHLTSGFHVDSLSRPEEARAAFSSARPDIVVCDYAMPFRDGEAVARELRALDDHIPIVILTAHDTAEKHIKLIKAGITRFVSKKTPFRDLERVLRDLVLEYAATRASKAATSEADSTERLVRAIQAARNELKVGRTGFAAERLTAALIRSVGPTTDDDPSEESQ